jgi:hypothetical protein
MTTQMSFGEFETDEEFFRYHLARHGKDRSLSALWQIFHGPSAVPAVPAEIFLQNHE